MDWIKESDLKLFLGQRDYDVRKTGNGRWIDQKCTPDVVSIVSDCILAYIETVPYSVKFTSLDIWHSDYAEQNVLEIFKKPNVENHAARNEYDKFFQQPMEMLAYSGVLNKVKKGTRNFYSINNKEVLKYIALGERNALRFIQLYIERVLFDTGLSLTFNRFFNAPSQATYETVKNAFTNMTKTFTRINGDTESWRIFTKVINPLSFKYNCEGTEKGRISKYPITYDMLMYNRDNFRDINSKKPKNLTRDEYLLKMGFKPSIAYSSYSSSKAKKYIRLFNDTYRGGITEVDCETIKESAIQMHHIFPESLCPEISGYYENIIALTPNQHFINAHPNGNTSMIDRSYQFKCLSCKWKNICDNNASSSEDHIYSKRCFMKVLDVGLETEDFEKMSNPSYQLVLDKLKTYFSDVA